jgi:hypothetical protein
MRLTRVKVENHSRLQDLELEVRQHMVLIGPNDVGKSSLLRCLDLLLGASTGQLYNQITPEDLRESGQPFVVEADLCEFSNTEQALFPDEITVDPNGEKEQTLTIRLEASFDDLETLSVTRTVPNKNTGRQLSREQLQAIGWMLLNANDRARSMSNDRRSLLDDVLANVELGDEQADFEDIIQKIGEKLQNSVALSELRGAMADQLSTALPERVTQDDLTFVPGAAADNNVLKGVHLEVNKKSISEQSDGKRAIYAIALYDLISNGANIVAIDEPEIHLHPSSQRSLARLLKNGSNQKIIATQRRRQLVDEMIAASGLPYCIWDDGVLDKSIAQKIRSMLRGLSLSEFHSTDDPLAFLRQAVAFDNEQDPDERTALSSAVDWCLDLLQKDLNPDTIQRRIQIGDNDSLITRAGVHLLTGHAGKGQQFDWMVVIGLEENYLPSYQAIQAGDNSAMMGEEARTLAVMLSRARHGVLVTSSDIVPDDYDSKRRKQQSRFLANLFPAVKRDRQQIHDWLTDADWKAIAEK